MTKSLFKKPESLGKYSIDKIHTSYIRNIERPFCVTLKGMWAEGYKLPYIIVNSIVK